MFEILVPVLIFVIPVMAVVVLTLVSGRRLQGSCGGVGPDGSCTRCGKPAAEIPAGRDRSACE
ncbi:MAG: hypothetical protein H6837_11630 [Planctomycetes bacterium]|nr:hypothetical protein [Planctomycetota bacterium]